MKENKHSVEVICSIMEAWPCFSDIQRLQLTLVCTALLSFPAKYSNHHIFAENAGHGAFRSVGRKRRLAGGGRWNWGEGLFCHAQQNCSLCLGCDSWSRRIIRQLQGRASSLPCRVTEGKQCLCWKGRMTTALMRSQPVAFLVANPCWPKPLWLVSRSKRTEQWNSCYLIYYSQTWEGRHDDCSSSMLRSSHEVEGNSCSPCSLRLELTMALHYCKGYMDQTSGCMIGFHTAFGELLLLMVF